MSNNSGGDGQTRRPPATPATPYSASIHHIRSSAPTHPVAEKTPSPSPYAEGESAAPSDAMVMLVRPAAQNKRTPPAATASAPAVNREMRAATAAGADPTSSVVASTLTPPPPSTQKKKRQVRGSGHIKKIRRANPRRTSFQLTVPFDLLLKLGWNEDTFVRFDEYPGHLRLVPVSASDVVPPPCAQSAMPPKHLLPEPDPTSKILPGPTTQRTPPTGAPPPPATPRYHYCSRGARGYGHCCRCRYCRRPGCRRVVIVIIVIVIVIGRRPSRRHHRHRHTS